MKNRQIKFKDKSNAYSVIIGKNLIKLLPKKIKSLCPKTNKVAVIIDRNVPKKYRLNLQSNLKKYQTIFLPFHASEKTKSIQYVNFFLCNNISIFLRIKLMKCVFITSSYHTLFGDLVLFNIIAHAFYLSKINIIPI